MRELRQELLNSERLAARFEDCPREKSLLQHGAPLSKQAAPAHLRQIPGYIKESVGGDAAALAAKRRKRGIGAKKKRKEHDPLQTLAFAPEKGVRPEHEIWVKQS